MIAIHRLIFIVIIAMTVSSCTSIKSSRPLTVVGVDTSGVQLLENDDGKTAVLTGKVARIIDRVEIENYVRSHFNYEKILNHITTE